MDEQMEIEEGLENRVAAFLHIERRHMGHHLEITFQKFYRNQVIASMPVDERTHQPFGILHGGASVVLAETAASVGAWLNIDQQRKVAVGLEINANHIRPMRSGKLIATAEPVHRGSQTQIWQIELRNEAGKKICVSRCTLAVIDKPKN